MLFKTFSDPALRSLSLTRFARHRTFVQRVVSIGFQEKVLQSDDHAVDVQHGFPVFSQNVKANVSFKVNVRVVDLQRQRENRHAKSEGRFEGEFENSKIDE